MKQDKPWLSYCFCCKRKHYVNLQPCPGCAGRGGFTEQPVSAKVAGDCLANYQCNGCEAYADHTGGYV